LSQKELQRVAVIKGDMACAGPSVDWPALLMPGSTITTSADNLGRNRSVRAENRRPNLFYLLFDTAATSIFENRFSSILGFTTTLSMTIFSGGKRVSLTPNAFLPTGRTLVSMMNGI